MKKTTLLFTALLMTAVHAYGQTSITATVGTPFSQNVAPASAIGYLMTVTPAGGSPIQEIKFDGLNYNNPTGVLSGTPTATGVFTVLIQQDIPGNTTGGTINTTLTVTVNPASGPVTPPPVTTASFCSTDPNPACGVVLNWQAPTGGSDPVVGYQIYRSTGTSSLFIKLNATNITGTTYTDNTILPNTTYDYYVLSVDGSGNLSVPSNTATVAVAAAPSKPTPPTPVNLTVQVVN